MLLVTVRPARPNEELRTRVQCEGRGVTMRFPLRCLLAGHVQSQHPDPGRWWHRSEPRGTYQGVRYEFVFTLRNEARPESRGLGPRDVAVTPCPCRSMRSVSWTRTVTPRATQESVVATRNL